MARRDPDTDVPSAVRGGAGRLWLARLTLKDFRCYGHLRLETGPSPVVLTGPNGAGKTNLLEAISFLVPGRGLRRARLDDVARRDSGAARTPAWAVAARAETPLGAVEIGTGLEAASGNGTKRAVRIDGRPAKTQAVLAETLNAHWLTPQMDRLFMEGASERRRFLDRLVLGFDASHAARVGAYDHARRERTRLLGGGADGRWLAALEDTMATTGVAVAAARMEMAARLDGALADTSGPFPGARVRATGEVEDWLRGGPALAAEDRLRDALAASRAADTAAGGATVGPHRGDLEVRHTSHDQPARECSTGEQKALLIALVLANARLQAADRGSVPLLLLDEVAAHLDRARRAALFDEIIALGAQAWLTGTDEDVFAPLRGRARFFGVDAAVVTARD